jgi:ribokinase
MTFDIITLGSATVDVLVESKNEVKKDRNHYDVAYHLGEKILIDKLNFTTGGGGTNTAVAFARLGLKTGFIGCLGDDTNGEMVLKELDEEGVEFLGKVKEGHTGYSVILPAKSDRTILAYKGVNNQLEPQDYPKAVETTWIYLSSMLGQSWESSLQFVEREKKKGAKLAFNASMYLAKQGMGKLKNLLKITEIFILNKEEAAALTREKKVEKMLKTLQEYSKIVVITDGAKPVYAISDGKIFKKSYPLTNVVDPTGAGDAFASGFVYGIMKGMDIESCLDYGHAEAKAVLEHYGAKNDLLRKL